MLVLPTSAEQPVLTIIFDTAASAGETVTVLDESGNELFAVSPAKSYQSLMMSLPELSAGETYQIRFNDEKTISVALDDMITTIDQNGEAAEITGGMGGGRGGRGGDMPGGGRPGGEAFDGDMPEFDGGHPGAPPAQ